MKLRKTLTILVTAILSATLFAGCASTSSKDAYESFSLLMNKLAGEGNWSDKGHEEKLKNGALVVNGLTVTMAPFAMPESIQKIISEASGQEIPEVKDQPRTMTVATVEIKNIMDKKAMGSLVALSDWRDQKALKLADLVTLKAVTQQTPFLGNIAETSIEEMSVSLPALSASVADAPDGMAGFIKAFNLEKFTYKNFKMTGMTPDVKIDTSIAEGQSEKVNFAGEPFKALDAFDPSGQSGISAAMNYQSASLKNFDLAVSSIDAKHSNFNLTMSLDSAIQKGASGIGKISDLSVSGLKYGMSGDLADKIGKEPGMPIVFNLAKLDIKGLDVSLYLKKMEPVFAAIATDPKNASKAISQIETLGDLFVSPISVNEFNVRGLELAVGDFVSIKLTEAGMVGPYIAGQIPANPKSHFKGLEIILPEDAKFNKGSTKSIYEFGRLFGMTRFFIDGENEASYDAETGILSSQTTHFEVKNLFEFSGLVELGGLTQERVEILNNTPLSMAVMALMAPDMILGDMSFNKMTMKFDDKGLTDRVFTYNSKLVFDEEQSPENKNENMKQMAIAAMKMELDRRGREILANPEVLSSALTDFLTDPKRLELKLDPQPPLSFKSVMAFNGNTDKILDSLNISVSANGQSSPTLKFAIDSAAGAPADNLPETDEEVEFDVSGEQAD